MQFKVPQNVQIEDRILPFLTLRQLVICAVGGGFAYLFYLGLSGQPTEIWLPPVVLMTAITVATAFLRINDIGFVEYMLLVTERYLNESRRYWQCGADNPNLDPTEHYTHQSQAKIAPNTSSAKREQIAKLSELTTMLDSPATADLHSKN